MTLFSDEKKRITTVGFVGDSILYGWGVAPEASCWQVFSDLTGCHVISGEKENPLALPGATLKNLVDRTPELAGRYQPELVFLCAGANHYDGDGRLSWPYGMTEEDLMGLFYALVSDLVRTGALVVWLGFPPFEGGGKEQKMARLLSEKVKKACGPLFLDSCYFLTQMQEDPQWDAMGGPFYDNLAMDLHPNAAGQRLIAFTCAMWLAEQNRLPA